MQIKNHLSGETLRIEFEDEPGQHGQRYIRVLEGFQEPVVEVRRVARQHGGPDRMPPGENPADDRNPAGFYMFS